MKDWGKIKIQYELKKKGVSAYCIKKALSGIAEDEYVQKLHHLLKKKHSSLSKEKNPFIRIQKTKNYLLQKGYESSLIDACMKPIYQK